MEQQVIAFVDLVVQFLKYTSIAGVNLWWVLQIGNWIDAALFVFWFAMNVLGGSRGANS